VSKEYRCECDEGECIYNFDDMTVAYCPKKENILYQIYKEDGEEWHEAKVDPEDTCAETYLRRCETNRKCAENLKRLYEDHTMDVVDEVLSGR